MLHSILQDSVRVSSRIEPGTRAERFRVNLAARSADTIGELRRKRENADRAASRRRVYGAIVYGKEKRNGQTETVQLYVIPERGGRRREGAPLLKTPTIAKQPRYVGRLLRSCPRDMSGAAAHFP